MREIVNLFSERESRDELGIGQAHDAISDLLWPGTSTLFTRARYFLFIPWCFRAAAEKYNDVAKATALEDRHERRLISALIAAGEKDGVIGGNVRAALKTLPASLYWGGMRTHGILNDANLSREDAIIAEVDRAHSRRPASAEYEDDDAPWHAGAFHSTLPAVPSGFPEQGSGGIRHVTNRGRMAPRSDAVRRPWHHAGVRAPAPARTEQCHPMGGYRASAGRWRTSEHPRRCAPVLDCDERRFSTL